MEKIYKGEIQRLLPIFQAMADGKTIQNKNSNGWIDIDGDEDGLNLDSLIGYQDCYRIKPEPKYRPFANVEECWNEMEKHKPFGWIIGKSNHIRRIIESTGSMFTCNGNNVLIGSTWESFAYMFKQYTFADGSIFGKSEE